MNWRLFVWMSLPWIVLWPELRHWLPGDADLGTIALRSLLASAPLVFAATPGRLDAMSASAAIGVACAGVLGALLVEARAVSALWESSALICAWVLALACLASGAAPARASARALALAVLVAPLSFVWVAEGPSWIERMSPWSAASVAHGSWASWPALAASALLALLGCGERVLERAGDAR